MGVYMRGVGGGCLMDEYGGEKRTGGGGGLLEGFGG